MNTDRMWQNEAGPYTGTPPQGEGKYHPACYGFGFQRFWGGVLLFIGLWLLLDNFGLRPMFWELFWPLLLIGVGTANLIRIWRMRD